MWDADGSWEKHKRLVVGVLLVAAVVAGVVLRVGYMPKFGTNFDLISYTIVAEIVENGGNVYAETDRYNYGPAWSRVVHSLATMALWFESPGLAFIVLLVVLLTLVDLGIMGILAKRFGTLPALIFMLHPVTIIVTGYKRQFDNLAILLGLLALELMLDRKRDSSLRLWLGLLLLGLSITTKHVLFAFPLWLAVKESGLSRKLLTLTVPVTIFFLSFVPFWAEGRAGILANVFGYSPGTLQPFWNALVPPLIAQGIPSAWGFFFALALFALVFRRRPMHESLLLYTLVLFIFSPEMANQYLAIPIGAVAVFMNPPFAAFSVAATLHLLKQLPNSVFPDLLSWVPAQLVDYPMCAALAFGGFVWIFHGARIVEAARGGARWLAREVRGQLAGKG